MPICRTATVLLYSLMPMQGMRSVLWHLLHVPLNLVELMPWWLMCEIPPMPSFWSCGTKSGWWVQG